MGSKKPTRLPIGDDRPSPPVDYHVEQPKEPPKKPKPKHPFIDFDGAEEARRKASRPKTAEEEKLEAYERAVERQERDAWTEWFANQNWVAFTVTGIFSTLYIGVGVTMVLTMELSYWLVVLLMLIIIHLMILLLLKK